MAAGAVLWIALRDGEVGLELFVEPGSWWLDLALGSGAALALLLVWEGALRVLPSARKLSEELASLIGPLSRPDVLGLACLSGFAEELLFRGALQGSVGVLWASLLFALLHSGPGPAFRVWTLFAAIAGIAFGGLMVWRGNLLGPIWAHALVNAVNLTRLLPTSPPETSEPS